jgi:hypothetical protein
MRMIKKVSNAIRENIHEAREKIWMAYRLHDEDRAVADWYKDMAAAHIAFNDKGHSIVTRLIEHAKEHMEGNAMLPGMMAVYNDLHADLKREAAEVQAMIQNYGKT